MTRERLAFSSCKSHLWRSRESVVSFEGGVLPIHELVWYVPILSWKPWVLPIYVCYLYSSDYGKSVVAFRLHVHQPQQSKTDGGTTVPSKRMRDRKLIQQTANPIARFLNSQVWIVFVSCLDFVLGECLLWPVVGTDRYSYGRTKCVFVCENYENATIPILDIRCLAAFTRNFFPAVALGQESCNTWFCCEWIICEFSDSWRWPFQTQQITNLAVRYFLLPTCHCFCYSCFYQSCRLYCKVKNCTKWRQCCFFRDLRVM